MRHCKGPSVSGGGSGGGGTSEFVKVADTLNGQVAVWGLLVFNNEMYGCTALKGCLFKWNGTDSWIELARSNLEMRALCVFNNKIYTVHYTTSGYGKLYEYDNAGSWVQKSTYGVQACTSLCVYNGKLYCTGKIGNLYEWDGVSEWVYVTAGVSQLGSKLCVHAGSLYLAIGFNAFPMLYKWNDVDTWLPIAYGETVLTPPYRIARSLYSYNGDLFEGCGDWSCVTKWNGASKLIFQVAYEEASAGFPESFAALDGILYAGGYEGAGSGNAGMVAYDGSSWETVASGILSQNYLTGLCAFNSKIYASTSPNGYLLEYTPPIVSVGGSPGFRPGQIRGPCS